MTLSLTEIEVKVLKSCLDEGSKLMGRLLASPHIDKPTKLVLKHDNLVIISIYNKIVAQLNKKHRKEQCND